MTTQQRCKRGLLFLAVLTAEYLLCRFALFSLHGMKDWPGFLACMALAIGVLFTWRKLWGGDVGLLVGYLLGLFIGFFFHKGVPHGTDNFPIL